MRSSRTSLASPLLGVLVAVLLAAAARASEIVVDSTADENTATPDNGTCTLREAILAANRNVAIDGCRAGEPPPASDVIRLPSGVYFFALDGSYEDLGETGDLDVREDLELRGDGAADTVIYAQRLDGVVEVHERVSASLFDVTLGGGSLGGLGQRRFGSVDLTRVALVDNIGTALGVSGDLTMTRGLITRNAAQYGAVALSAYYGRVRLVDTTVEDNLSGPEAGVGISLGAAAELVLVGSSLVGTSVSLQGARLELRESTLSSGRISAGGAEVALENATVTAVTADVPALLVSSSSLRAERSIVAGSCSFTEPAEVESLGGNVEWPRDTCRFAEATDQVGVEDLGLLPLAENGGPTPTHALHLASPAIDVPAAATGCPPKDQRGVPRPQDGDADGVARCDAGAYELACSGPDADGDGIALTCDDCPAVSNADQTDADRDGAGDACDSCPGLANRDQTDADADGLGDACDVCPAAPDAGQADGDEDGAGDACDSCPGDPNPHQRDADEDGAGDACDDCTDADGDGYGGTAPNGCPHAAVDCDDENASVNPGMPEVATNDVDDDCDYATPDGARYVVTRSDDAYDGACDAADCSLREAVVAANRSPGLDVVMLPAGTYAVLTGGFEDDGATSDLDVNGPTAILGAGARTTVIDGGGCETSVFSNDGLLDVRGPGRVVLADLTLRRACAHLFPRIPFLPESGGAIRLDDADLRLERCTLTANGATGAGGAIYSTGHLHLLDSSVHGNSAQTGFGIAQVGGSLMLEGTTLAESDPQYGRAGLYLDGASFTAVHATIVGTGDAIGLRNADGPLRLAFEESLVSGRCRAIEVTSAYEVVSEGGNVEGPGDWCGLRGPTDRDGVADLGLGVLGNHGGPTDTVPLTLTSPAVDAGARDVCPEHDQRGYARVDDACDAGAFELGALAPGGLFDDGFESGDLAPWPGTVF